mmetsp:Transcript_8180/g.27002  ORF Transcript_8180/g.27002 Transcript_8180/m.27002 type:complete len:348 (+) Transcript_8180:1121-2164(+)
MNTCSRRHAPRRRRPLLLPFPRLLRRVGVPPRAGAYVDRDKATLGVRCDRGGEVDGLDRRRELRPQPRLLASRRAEEFFLAGTVAAVGVVKADEDEPVAGAHLVAGVLDVAVMHEAVPALRPKQNPVHVARHGGKIRPPAGELVLVREAQVEGERRLILVELQAASAWPLRRGRVSHNKQVARPRVWLFVEGGGQVGVLAPGERQELLADGSVDQVLALLRQVLHQHVLRWKAHAPVAPADGRADLLGIVQDELSVLRREHLDRVHTRGPPAARTRLFGSLRVELDGCGHGRYEGGGTHTSVLREATSAIHTDTLDSSPYAIRARGRDPQLAAVLLGPFPSAISVPP